MILTCPNCGTQYVVKDGAIPPQGRQVRCASCKHSWHQDSETTETPAEPESEPRVGDEESIAEATMIEPRSGPEAEERAYEEAMIQAADSEAAPTAAEDSWAPAAAQRAEDVSTTARFEEAREREAAEIAAENRARDLSADVVGVPVDPLGVAADWREPPQPEAADDEFSPFPAADDAEPRRRSPLTIILIILLLVAVVAAAVFFLAPQEMKARLGLTSGSQTPLALVTTHMDRQKLESGNELLTVTGRVINPTAKEQDVPPLQAQLRSKTGQVIYSWTIAPPARTLPAGASASFNSAELNVPPGGDEVTFRLGEPRG